MKFVVALIALAACAAAESLAMKEAAAYRLEVPKDGNLTLSFTIPNATAHLAVNPKIGFHVKFVTWSTERVVRLFHSGAGAAESAAMDYTSRDSEQEIVLTAYTDGCHNGCTVNIKLMGLCNYQSCLNSITVDIWARVKGATDYVYTNSKQPYVPLHKGLWAFPVQVTKGAYNYYIYASTVEEVLPVHKMADVLANVQILSGGNTITKPTGDNQTWVQLGEEDKKFFVGNNYIGMYGTEQMGSSFVDASVCIGQCSPAAVAAPFLFLVSALLALLF